MDFWIKAYYILLTKIKRPSPSMCAWHQSGSCKGLNWVMEMNSETTGYFSTDSSGRDPAMIRIPSCKTCRAKLEMVNAFQATSREIRGHSLKSKEAVEGHTIHLLQSIDSVVSKGRGDGHPEEQPGVGPQPTTPQHELIGFIYRLCTHVHSHTHTHIIVQEIQAVIVKE